MRRMFARIVRRWRTLSTSIFRGFFQKKIRKKWECDRKLLPLDEPAREMYEIIHWHCLRELGRFPDLVESPSLNDRINWTKLFDQDEEIVRCCDKVLVRDFVRERIGESYLLDLYQVRDCFHDIDREALPESFVIKTNHASGTVIFITDKKAADWSIAEEVIRKSLAKPYGWENGEWAYAFVKPKVFVEKLICPESSTGAADYKFYCADGKVKFCQYIYNRGLSGREQLIDVEGRDLGMNLCQDYLRGTSFKKPTRWNEMKEISEKLSRGFKHVRVDLYYWNDCVYFGEMTFWPMAGAFRSAAQKKMASYLDFDRSTFKPFIIPRLRSRLALEG